MKSPFTPLAATLVLSAHQLVAQFAPPTHQVRFVQPDSILWHLPREVDIPLYGGVFPHVAAGGTWKTRLAIFNPRKTGTAEGELAFYASNGQPLTLDLLQDGRIVTGAVFRLQVGPRQTAFLEAVSRTGELKVGFAHLTVWEGALLGNAIFRESLPDRPDREAVVPLETNAMRNALFPFDNTNGFVTSVAIVNPASYGDCNLVIEVYDERGEVLGVYRKTLKRLTHTAFESNREWPASSGQKGHIRIEIEGFSTAFSALALLFNPTGSVTSALVAHGVY